jgi:hypothetical protein
MGSREDGSVSSNGMLPSSWSSSCAAMSETADGPSVRDVEVDMRRTATRALYSVGIQDRRRPAKTTSSSSLISIPSSSKADFRRFCVQCYRSPALLSCRLAISLTQPSSLSHFAQGRCSLLKPLPRPSSPFMTQPYRLILLTCSSRYNLCPATELVSFRSRPLCSAITASCSCLYLLHDPYPRIPWSLLFCMHRKRSPSTLLSVDFVPSLDLSSVGYRIERGRGRAGG